MVKLNHDVACIYGVFSLSIAIQRFTTLFCAWKLDSVPEYTATPTQGGIGKYIEDGVITEKINLCCALNQR